MDIIFATRNQNKLKEIRKILSEHNIIGIDDININIVEDGESFYENALIKARGIGEYTKKITIADDSGLEIDFMDKKPGINSARYLGEDTDYKEKNRIILELMKDVKKEFRTARFVCGIVAYFPDKTILSSEGILEGEIHTKQVGENGFGYDPIFYVSNEKMTLAQMPSDLKNKISHRSIALSKINEKLMEVF